MELVVDGIYTSALGWDLSILVRTQDRDSPIKHFRGLNGH